MRSTHTDSSIHRPNELSDRAAMGLPDRLLLRLPPNVFACHGDLVRVGSPELELVCADECEPFGRRYVAGTLLGLLGDPRIRLDDPFMAELPGREVEIGLPDDEVDRVVARWASVGVIADWIRKECPRHQVSVGGFRMMRYPVTNVEYAEFAIATGLQTLPTSWRFGRYPDELANHPVWTVRPPDAEAYACWLSARTGRHFRLPTEAEWEYAASGGTAREYPWGDQLESDRANTVEFGPLGTTPVGIYPAGESIYGVADLGGNVEELVGDDYRPYPGGAVVEDDLHVASGPSYRVTRGGSFTRFGDLARCQRRHGCFEREIYATGFRLVEVR